MLFLLLLARPVDNPESADCARALDAACAGRDDLEMSKIAGARVSLANSGDSQSRTDDWNAGIASGSAAEDV
jgi:hypothetical protein